MSTVLFVSANPEETVRLRLQDEVKRVTAELGRRRPGGRSGEVEIEVIGAATPEDLRKGLADYQPAILHFSGHGSPAQGIFLEDSEGGALALSGALLERLCRHFSHCLECVVLNACYTSDAVAGITRHVDYVVAMQSAIPDEIAIEFSAAFYDEVASRKPIPDAYDLACWTIEATNQARLTKLYEPSELRFKTGSIPEVLPTHEIPILIERNVGEQPVSRGTEAVGEQPTSLPWLNVPTIQRLARGASETARVRGRGKLPQHRDAGKTLRPVGRLDTAPNFEAFLDSDRSILAIIADSGYGKSTLMLQLGGDAPSDSGAPRSRDRYIPVLFDAQQMESAGSLSERLARDFGVASQALHKTLDMIATILEQSGQQLVIFVDAINESVNPSPVKLKAEIEDLAARTPPALKVVYSCRKVYWDTYIEPRHNITANIYYGGQPYRLGRFSPAEAKSAFEVYQDFQGFRGRYQDLKSIFRERLRNPLMLRLIAEAYEDRDLPTFAPAVLVFRAYEENLGKKFRATGIMRFLDDLLASKAQATARTDLAAETFSRIQAMELASYSHAVSMSMAVTYHIPEPLTALHDEGVIYFFGEGSGRFRFTYDRFFEYLLGKALFSEVGGGEEAQPVTKLIKEVRKSGDHHFSYWQALKSEVVRQNLLYEGGAWDMRSPQVAKELLHAGPLAFEFGKEVLRELAFEGGVSVEYLLALADDRTAGLFMALDIAGDHSDVVPILIDALFSGDRALRLRATSCIAQLNREPSNRTACLSSVLDHISREDILDQLTLQGLVYLTAAEFAVTEREGHASEQCKRLWKNILERSSMPLYRLIRALSEAVATAIRDEGELFFGEGFTSDGILYYWGSMGEQEKDAANCLCQSIDREGPFTASEIDVLQFFASAKRRWADRKKPRKELHAFQLEYRLTEYLLVRRSKRSFDEVLTILGEFSSRQDWFLIDFSLVVMRDIMRFAFAQDRARLERGFKLMIEWDRSYEAALPEHYYRVLAAEDPFSMNSVPLYLTAVVDAEFFTEPNEPISVVQREVESGDRKRILMALLAIRLLARKGRCGLGSLLQSFRPVLNSHDPAVRSWVDQVLRELHLLQPRLLDYYLLEERMPRSRVSSIRHQYRSRDVQGVAHNGEPLYRFLLLGPRERLEEVKKWHCRLLNAETLESFAEDLVDWFIRGTLMSLDR